MHVYVMLFVHLLLLSTIVESSSVTLTQISPHGVTVCPGQDLVYNCTLTDVPTANVLWAYSEQGVVVMQLSLNVIGKSENSSISFGSFTIRVLQNTFDSNFSIVTTATLNGALLSHNNTNIRCIAVGIMDVNDDATILISGAISRPPNLTLVPQSSTSISLSWSSPDNNCMFSYVVNGSSNGLVTQYRTNTTSLTITDLSVAMSYHFAVAVEDANLTTGPWSEVVDILWDVPQLAPFNISIVTMMDFLFINWTVPQIESTLVTHYILTHNLTATGSTTIINNTSPVVKVSLDGVPPGHYSVNVTAVNIVGQGTSAQDTVTVILSSTSAGIAVTSTYSAENSPIENGVPRSSSTGDPNASTADTSSVTLTSMSELTPSLPTMSASGSTTTVIAASLGVIVVISIVIVITITGAIMCFRIKNKTNNQQQLTKPLNDESTANSYSLFPENCVELQSKEQANTMFHGGIIYADLGRAPNKVAPAIPPQAAEPVVYSSVRQQNEKKSNPKPQGIIYADLGRAPKTVRPAVPPQAAEPVVYSSVTQLNEKQTNPKPQSIIYADLGRAPNKVAPAIPPQAAEPVVYSSIKQHQNEDKTKCKKDENIIYADLGVAKGATPVAPPAVNRDKIIYASVQQ